MAKVSKEVSINYFKFIGIKLLSGAIGKEQAEIEKKDFVKIPILTKKKDRKFKVREYNRCPLCGRPRAFLRRFKMCRICFRTLASSGEIPGVIKSSW